MTQQVSSGFCASSGFEASRSSQAQPAYNASKVFVFGKHQWDVPHLSIYRDGYGWFVVRSRQILVGCLKHLKTKNPRTACATFLKHHMKPTWSHSKSQKKHPIHPGRLFKAPQLKYPVGNTTEIQKEKCNVK